MIPSPRILRPFFLISSIACLITTPAIADDDYVAIAKAYANFMIEHGRDVYGKKHTPLFVTGIDRHSGKMISPPFAHVKRKPFMPGWERDRELRGSDRNYGHADPLDQLTLLKIMHRLTEVTGDKRYAEEADKTASWWLANAQTGIGLYPWGSHTSWNVDKDGGGGRFEFNHVWPYWKLNPDALQNYAMGLWDHYVADKDTGDFNRHAHSSKHGPGGGMEFPWPGSAMIAIWAEAYLANPDPEYVRAINTILKRWESLRDKNGILAPCSKYGEWAWYDGYMIAANRLDDWAERIKDREPELAKRMRDYGRTCDANYVKVADNLLDIKRVGPVMSYLRATGGYNPERLDILGGPWQDRKHYAMKGLLLHERMKRNDSPALQKSYHQAVLDIAEVYMSVNPEVQWSVWGVNMSHAIELMLAAHELTDNPAYLHRADHFGRLAVDLFVDEASPLPKFTSHDDFYEIESVTLPSTDLWMLAILDLHERLAAHQRKGAQAALITTGQNPATHTSAPLSGASSEGWQKGMTAALAEKQGGVWDCTELKKPAASVCLSYGKNGEKELFLSRRKEGFAAKGLPVDGLELIASDCINTFPTLAEVKPFNGPYRRKFSGKHREPSTATYGGFKDVLDKAGLLLANHGKETATVTVTVQLHDSWDDRGTKNYEVTLKPGTKALVPCDSPEKRFIRRLDLKSTVPGAVKLEKFAFAMTPRSKLNPLSAHVAAATPAAKPDYSAFDKVEAKRIADGLVLDLVGATLAKSIDGVAAKNQPKLVTAQGKSLLRFDGRDDAITIPDSDTLDLKAWTLIALVRATGGNGVVIGKIDGKNAMMNYRLQVAGDTVSAVVRGASANEQVNRQARANVLNRFAVIAARFDPQAKGADKITIEVDGRPMSYRYQNVQGNVKAITHDAPLLIGRQPGREPRHFKGDIAGALLYNKALGDKEMSAAAKWLLGQKPDEKAVPTAKATTKSAATKADEAVIFLIAGQSNAGGVAAFSPETNKKAGLAGKHPTIPGSTAKEVGIPTTADAYPRSYIWGRGFEQLTPGKNLKGGYRDPWRHGIELPMAILLQKQFPKSDICFIKHGPGGHNLHTQWKAGVGPDYKTFMGQFTPAMADLKKRYKKVRVIGLYWDQGESDQKQATQYEDNLRAFFAALRKDTGIPDLQIYVREQGIFQHAAPDFRPIVEAQIQICKEDSNAHLLKLDLGSNEKNFKAWAWTDNNGHLSSKAYKKLSTHILALMKDGLLSIEQSPAGDVLKAAPEE